MRRSRAFTYLALVVLGLGLSTSILAIQQRVDLEWLCRGAEHIVIGTVTDVRGYRGQWPGVGEVIFSDVTIEPSAEWKGSVPRGVPLVLQVPGGLAPDGVEMRVSEAPRFTKGEKVLVFVHTFLDRLWVRGWEQGKYTIFVERVAGSASQPISEDILTHALKRKVDAILAAQAIEPGEKKAGDR